MADSSKNLSFHCDTLSLRHISSSFFNISGSRVGVGVKGVSDSESVWSPTSPLDFRLFSNLSNPFSIKSSRASSQGGLKKKLDCSKVGLGIISSLANENKLNKEILGLSQRKNMIFGSQVKTGNLMSSKKSHESLGPVKSNSLPKNYVIPFSKRKNSKPEIVSFDDVSRNKKFSWGSEAFKSIMTSLPDSTKPSSPLLINSYLNSNLGNNDFCVENTSAVTSLHPVTGRSSQVTDSLKIKSSSLPISIDFSNGHIGSLSAREIELSEYYTCIISHGPNPKRTHIYGDCVLECHKNELTQSSSNEEPVFRSSQVSTFSEGSVPYPSGNFLSFCYSCKKKLEEGKDVYIYRGEKAFCSFACRSEEIFAEEELQKTNDKSAESSPDSSYCDLFLMGLSMAN